MCMASSENKTNQTASEASWEHFRDQGVHFSLQGEDGLTQVMCWEPTRLRSPGGQSMLNTGVSPSAASECSLSLVLEHRAGSEIQAKYSLSARAVQGIL